MHTAAGEPGVAAWRRPFFWWLLLLSLGALSGWLSASWALALGLASGLAVGNPFEAKTRALSKHVLALAVVGLGAGMDLHAVVDAGLRGVLLAAFGIALAFALAAVLRRWLRVAPKLATLIAAGTAICGGSAIAACAPALEAEPEDASMALLCVFVLNAVALWLFPPLGALCGLSQEQFGLWCALAIHDTSSVVGAATAYGEIALGVAVTTKLARALWILPLSAAMAWQASRARAQRGVQDGKPAPRASVPWFLVGFVLVAAVASWWPAVAPVASGLLLLAKRLLVWAIALLGASMSVAALRKLGPRPMLLASALWVVMASVSLLAVQWG